MEELYEEHNYPSKARFYQIVKQHGLIKSHREISDFVDSQYVHQVNKKLTKNKNQQRFIVASQPYDMLQIDLVDMSKYSHANNGVHFIFVAVDVFTRQGYAVPMKDKTASSTLAAFQKINIMPNALYHDQGTEYKRDFDRYCQENNIANITNFKDDHTALGVIDRFCKTLKTMIFRYMAAKKSNKYVARLKPLIDLYNNTPHNGIGGLKPAEIEDNDENMQAVTEINNKKTLWNKRLSRKNKINVGDSVRVQLQMKTFKKGYEINYSTEVYQVEKINSTSATLNNGDTVPIKLLQKVADDSDDIENPNEENEKKSKVTKVLKQEGLDKQNIISKKRKHKTDLVKSLIKNKLI